MKNLFVIYVVFLISIALLHFNDFIEYDAGFGNLSRLPRHYLYWDEYIIADLLTALVSAGLLFKQEVRKNRLQLVIVLLVIAVVCIRLYCFITYRQV